MENRPRSDRMPKCRYNAGGVTVSTNTKLGWWEKAIWTKAQSDIPITITPKYNHNPSLMANDFYGDDRLDWIILQNNNIVDVYAEFVTGAIVHLPTKNRVFTEILSKFNY